METQNQTITPKKVERKKRGRLQHNQKKDKIKTIRAFLRVYFEENDKIELDKLDKIIDLLKTK